MALTATTPFGDRRNDVIPMATKTCAPISGAIAAAAITYVLCKTHAVRLTHITSRPSGVRIEAQSAGR